MRTLFAFAVSLLLSGPTRTWAQQYRLLTTSQDLKQTNVVDSIVFIRASDEANHIWVKYKNGQKVKIQNATVWGFIDRKGRVYRFAKGHIYKVVSQGDPVLYERDEQRWVGKPVYTGNSVGRYQSTGLDGEVRPRSYTK